MESPYSFEYSERALAFLEGLPKKQAAQIIEKISRLALNPIPLGSKQLHGAQDGNDAVRRIRQGDYRVLYVVRETIIVVLDIGHRKDVYG